MIVNIQEVNEYLVNRFNAENWIVVPDSKLELAGKVSCFGTLYEFNGIGTEFQKLEVGNIVAVQNTLYKIREIVSQNKIRVYPVDSIPTFNTESIYKCTESDYQKQSKILKAIITSEKQLLSSQDWIVPSNTTSQNVKDALCEWALWLLNGGKSDAQVDQEQGILVKKIDVLQWNYSGKYIKPGPTEAHKLLQSFENPDYFEGDDLSTSFSMR